MIEFKGKVNKEKNERVKFTESVYPLPKSVIKLIVDSLKSIKFSSSNSSSSLTSSGGGSKNSRNKSNTFNNQNTNISLRKIFLRDMTELLRKAEKHTVFLIDNTPIFNK